MQCTTTRAEKKMKKHQRQSVHGNPEKLEHFAVRTHAQSIAGRPSNCKRIFNANDKMPGASESNNRIELGNTQKLVKCNLKLFL